LASADPALAAELSAGDQAAAAWESALAGIEAALDATELWLNGLDGIGGDGIDGDGRDGAADAGAGVGQMPLGAGVPAAPTTPWTLPKGLPALPADQAGRVLGLLERQRDLADRVTEARQAVGGQLEAVRQVLATKAPAPGIYLDTKG